jgi:hypothetical protein
MNRPSALFLALLVVAAPACHRGQDITGPSETTATMPTTPTALPESQRIMLIEVKRATRDPKFPGTARNAIAVSIWGQIRNAMETLQPNESLSGGQAIIRERGCPDAWKFQTGFHNGTPRDSTDTTTWASVPTCDQVSFTIEAQVYPTNRVVKFNLASDKIRIVSSGLSATQEGGEWRIKGAFSAVQ